MVLQRLIRPFTARCTNLKPLPGRIRHRSFHSMNAEPFAEPFLSSDPEDDEIDVSRLLGQHKNIIDVTGLALKMRREVRAYVKQSPASVRLVGLLAENGSDRTDTDTYSSRIAETFAQDGIQYEVCRCKAEEPADVEAAVQRLNERRDVHGVLIFYPIFERMEREKGPYLNRLTGVHYKTQDDWIRDRVSPEKDVEALSSDYNARYNFRARATNRTQNEVYVPCTALAVDLILDTYHTFGTKGSNRWEGATVTIVNRSEIFGRPLAALLALKGANVYSVDDNSILKFMPGGRMRRCANLTLKACLEKSCIVVTGVPSPDFVLPSESIAPGATVVDVSEFSNVDSSLLDRTDLKLIPNVGKVTIAALEQNLVRLHRRKLRNMCYSN